jgi:2-haloacid dehalogenase
VQGLRKPDASIFPLVCNHLSIDAEQAVLIDDRQANVEAADAAGLTVVLMTSADGLRQQLQSHGVLP